LSKDGVVPLSYFREGEGDVKNELSNKFQIILTEQADFDDDWHQDAIVNRPDEGLIPPNWINTISNE
jgi:hypothetical protein